jgi:FkbM family methyltransferase
MSIKLRYLYRAYRYRYRVDPAELKFVCRHLARGQVAVDVGCHKGAYTYWMRRCVGASGAVIAFEPQPRQVVYLREAFSAMRYDNVAIVPVALSSAPGAMNLFVPPGEGFTHAASLEPAAWGREPGTPVADAPGSKTIDASSSSAADAPSLQNPGAPVSQGCTVLSVQVTTLDNYFSEQARKPNFIKIDVEGHELAVLEGGRQTLAAYRPSLLIECEARHRADGDVRPVFDFLKSLGYEGSFFVGRERRPLAEFDPKLHQCAAPRGHDLPRGYVNNFGFVRNA